MGKKKKILLFGGLFLLLVTAAVGIYLGVSGRFASNSEMTSKLYWNLDRDEYIPELGGDTIRKPEEDGLYTVRFLVDGEVVTYRVEDRETMISVDEKSALGLVVNKNGIIKEAIDIRDMGIREVAKSFYVQTMQDGIVVANSSVTGSAVDVSLRVNSETSIWNVTGKVEPIGVKDDLQLMDCIRAFNNEQGQITDIYIVDREDILNGVSAERYCDHCEQVVTWRMWLGDASLPYSSGHFRLIKDVELPDQYSMPADTDLILDLNGKTVARKTQGRIISLHAEGDQLSIIDGSEEKTGLIKAYGEYAANGGVIWVRYGTFNLYAGTIDASKVVDAGANGAAIQVNPDTTFNMYGGKIIGGTSKPAVLKSEETGEKYTSGGMGGAIYCQGTINMYKGEITGGKVVSAKDHKGQMAGIAGGNIALISKGTMNMYGGKITGGTVATPDGHGGNISVRSEGAVLNIKGGEIVNGVSMLQGANVASWGTITMTGGTIKGGKNMTGTALKGAKYNEESTSHNIFLVSSKLDMKGGTIGGYVDAVNGLQNKKGEYLECKLIFSGSAKIKGGKTNLTARTNMIQLGKLSSGAYISVNGSGYISKETVASNQNYVHSDYEGSDVLYLEKRLFIGKQACVCGLNENGDHFGECDGTLLAWQPWTKATYAPIEEGNWYLLTDVQAEGIVEPKPDVTIRLDLNGKTIVGAEDRRVYSTVNGNVNLTITDLSEEKKGSIIAQTGEKPENLGRGGCVWVTNKESKVTFYGGILDARKVTSVYNGAAVSVDPGCTFTMYGGTINGGKAIIANDAEGFAGSVFVRGQFFLNAGVIQGGEAAAQGGNVYVHDESGAKFVMTGGKVLDGKASQGGNLSGMGLLSIEGGTVANGEAEFGGNVGARRKMVMTGGEIINGTATYGGNIYAGDSSDVTISGGTISGGKSLEEGGNLRVWTNSKLNISNAVIKDGEAKGDGGNIYLNDLIDAKIKDSLIIGGKSYKNGGNICIGKGVEKPSKVVIADTQIREGYAENHGGNVYVRKSNTTLSGAVVILDAFSGGNLYIEKDVKVSLDNLTSANGSIGVTSVDSTFAKNAKADKSDVAKFVSDDGFDIAQTSANELFYGRVGCMCGYHNNTHKEWCTEDMRNIEWHAWTDDKSLPGESEAGRYYYLTKDVNLTGTFELNAQGTWGLDLNGKTITAPDRAFNLGGDRSNLTYKITDTSAAGTGKIKYRDSVTSASGMLFFVRDGANVEFYAGTISGEGPTTTYGCTLVVANECTFTMYGGLILPGNSQTAPAKGNYSTNCVEVRQGTLDVRGGTIEGEVRITTTAGRLKVSGSAAKVGVAVSNDANKAYGVFALHNGYNDIRGKVELNNLTVPGQLVIKNRMDLTFTEATGSNSSIEAIQLLDDADEHYKVVKLDGEIRIVSVICVCGENVDGKDSHTCAWTGAGNGIEKVHNILWQPWNAEAGALPANSGYYYLTEDMNLTARATVNEAEVYLDLNGHKATATNDENRVIFINNANANYSITDSSENQTGAIQFDKNSYKTAKYNGMLIFYVAPGKVNLYGGTLDMSNVQTVSASMIDVSQGEFNVLGGTIKPAAGRASGQSNAISARNSGLVSVLGGTVYGEVLLQTKANTLTVGGDAKVGLPMDGVSEYGILAWEEDTEVICKNLTADADIRVASIKIKLSDANDSSSEISAIKLLADNDGHNAVVKYNNKVRTASIICVCGENVKDKTSHTCAWTGAGNGIEKVFNIKWQAHTAASGALPGASEAGYYYLTKDYALTRSDLKVVSYLDLNGKTVTASNSWNIRIESADANYAITDSKGNGTIKLPEGHNFGVWGAMISFQQTGTFTVYGGTIDMSNATNGTYAHIDVLKGKFVMHGGTIIPVKIDPANANAIHVRTSTVNSVTYDGSVEIMGGTVYGEVILQNPSNTLTVGGDAKVGLPMDGIAGYGILAWEPDTNVICKNLTADADIRVNSINIKLSDANDSSSEISAIKLLADNGGHNGVVKYNNKVRIASIICVCGENVKDKTSHTCAWTGAGNGIEKVFNIKWQAHTAASGALPGASEAGYYYLTKDYALSRSDLKVVSYLDLNGKTVTATNGWNIRIESENANYAITDSKGNGKIQLPEGHTFGGTANGAMISFQKPGTFTVYGGTIDMSNSTNGTYPHIDIQKGQFVMHGGTIIPVKTSTSSNALYARSSAWNGGIAYGTIQVTGGTIYGVVALANSSNTITVSGNAMIGLPMEGTIKNGIDIWSGNTPVYCSNLADTARVIFYTKGNEKLTDGYEIVNVNGELLLKKKATQ